MDGFEFVALIESELKKLGMSKGEFYTKSGISSATFSQWRNRIYSPSSDAIRKVEKTLNVEFSIEQKEKPTDQMIDGLNSDYSLLNRKNKEFIDKMIAELLKSQSSD